jgi:NAD(P)H-hydrate repair Nnr-like enzyme with NAD(P)H-hydrate dehydratase domain
VTLTLTRRALANQQSRALACQSACTLVRRACKKAYAKRRRAMVAPDVLAEVGGAFEELTEVATLRGVQRRPIENRL